MTNRHKVFFSNIPIYFKNNPEIRKTGQFVSFAGKKEAQQRAVLVMGVNRM